MAIDKIKQNAPEWRFDIKSGKYPTYVTINKFGVNPEITTSTDPEDVWAYGGLYTFTTTAQTYYMSSSDNGDTQDIEITATTEDSNGNWNRETWTRSLAGQTKTALSPPSGDDCIRFSRAINKGSTDFAGTVYFYEDDTTTTPGVPDTASKVRGSVNNGDNQTLQCIETVPTGYVAFFFKGETGMTYTGSAGAGVNFATMVYHSRRFGSVFATKKQISIINNGTSDYLEERAFPDPIPAKSDLKIKVKEVSETMGVYAAFDLLLIPEDEFSDDFLNSIGQIKRVD